MRRRSSPPGRQREYALAPQGDFAPSDGWTLNKQATVVDGADPFSGAQHSLQLEKDAEAATPAMCVNLDNPTIRFFVRDLGGNGKANLKVDVLYEDLDGHVKHLTVAKLRRDSEWQPSVIVPMYMNMLAAASPDGLTAVAFKFKAEGSKRTRRSRSRASTSTPSEPLVAERILDTGAGRPAPASRHECRIRRHRPPERARRSLARARRLSALLARAADPRCHHGRRFWRSPCRWRPTRLP